MAQSAESRLIGRSEELALLERALGQLARGHAGAFELRGEPGIGKSRLLSELRSRAAAEGHLVLSGRASEFECELPFGVFVDAVDPHLRSLGSDRQDRLGAELGAELGRLFPALGELAPADGALHHERYRAHRAVRELFERLAAVRPVLVALDDMHWADPASAELLGALLRNPPRAPVLLALAVRPRQLPPRLANVLVDARRAGLAGAELRPLDEAEAAELLARVGIGPPQAAELYAQSGGNPFYLEQLARAAGREAAGEAAIGRTASIALAEAPEAVVAALAGELALLTPQARALLEGAAVAGDPFEIDLAARIAELPLDAALVALDELARLDLVRSGELPRRFRFRHPLVHEAVHGATAEGWRLAAHERAARALAEWGAPATARAHHVERSARPDDREAITLLRDAGDAVAHRAPENAARWYETGLRLLRSDAELPRRIELLESLARALAATGQVTESRERLLEALALAPDDEVALWVELTVAVAGVESLLGHNAQARARLVGALERLPDSPTPEAAAIMTELAEAALYSSDFEAMTSWGARALAASRSLDDRPLTAAATTILALAGVLSGQIDEARVHCAEAATLVDALRDDELALRLDAIVHLAAMELCLDRYRDALRHAERGKAVARATGQERLFPLLIVVSVLALQMLGRLGEAADVADGAIEAARLTGEPQSLQRSLYPRSWVAILAGDLDTALRSGKESVEMADRVEQGVYSIFARAILGWALLEAGEPASCVKMIPAAAGGSELPLIAPTFRALFQEVLTHAWIALDRVEEAALAAGRAETTAEQIGHHDLTVTAARRARAAVMLAVGEPHQAAELALAAAAAAERIDAPIEAARSRLLAGRAFAATGDRARSASELELAAADLEACGALRYRQEAGRELHRLGRRFQPRKRPLPPSSDLRTALTPRELEIAELVTQGKTNRQIAAELFLSEKTIETHLHHSFKKLGLSSRTSLARVVALSAGGASPPNRL